MLNTLRFLKDIIYTDLAESFVIFLLCQCVAAIYSVRNRCGNPLGSAWRRQMKTISKDIIKSSNDMKIQTSKYHTFSVLLFNQLSLYMQCSREFFH